MNPTLELFPPKLKVSFVKHAMLLGPKFGREGFVGVKTNLNSKKIRTRHRADGFSELLRVGWQLTVGRLDWSVRAGDQVDSVVDVNCVCHVQPHHQYLGSQVLCSLQMNINNCLSPS